VPPKPLPRERDELLDGVGVAFVLGAGGTHRLHDLFHVGGGRSAWEYCTRETRRVLDESAVASDLDEDEAMRVATEEVSRVRRRRRSSGS
jgi:hypothetical protein